MEQPAYVHERDVRKIVRLLGDVAGMSEPFAARKRTLMQGLGEMVQADRWLWVISQLQDDREAGVLQMLHEGFNEQQLAVYFDASYRQPPKEQVAMMEAALLRRHVTRRRQQLLSDEDWQADPAVQTCNRPMNVGQSVYSLYPLDGITFSCVGLHRSWGAEPFTPYEARLVHIVLSEIPWLHQVDISEMDQTGVPTLPPRLRTVLGLLLDGQHRQQIAQNLNLSPYTVRDYMSQLYRHFNVTSQLELIKRFTLGDGGDRLSA